ncbi:MAG TPA: tail fiber domain-containing protein [Thermoanaerobaculia bacterium]|nr:tail fiber domain-containing protein [Thermoanaerobaculia bacterium]
MQVKPLRSKLLCGLAILFTTTLGFSTAAAASPGSPQSDAEAVKLESASLQWEVPGKRSSGVLTIAGPGGSMERREIASGSTPAFSLYDAKGFPRPDGSYKWELVLAPEGAGSAGRVLSGSFQILNGAFVQPGEVERPASTRRQSGPQSSVAKDQTVGDDLIVFGSLCVGLDCVNGESFGADNLRLKANVLRLKFDDTSTGGFPANDWQLTANDSGSGGLNKFSIEDITGAKVPFTLEAGAPNNSLYVSPSGRIGVGTSVPAAHLHVATGNTPSLRLEQNVSGGLPARTWDVAGSDTAFAVKDVTGATTPLQIQPGAPTNSLYLNASGYLGINTASPAVPFHIYRDTGTPSFASMLKITNRGGIQFLLERLDGNDWQFSNFGASFQISVPGSPVGQFNLVDNGDLQIGHDVYAHAFIPSSSRELKENFSPVNGREILAKLAAMPLTEWSFRTEPAKRHIGPVAEDFQATFGLGQEGQGLNLTDVNGVTIAALQGLHAQVEEQRQTIEKQQALIRQLEERLARLEGKQSVEHE